MIFSINTFASLKAKFSGSFVCSIKFQTIINFRQESHPKFRQINVKTFVPHHALLTEMYDLLFSRRKNRCPSNCDQSCCGQQWCHLGSHSWCPLVGLACRQVSFFILYSAYHQVLCLVGCLYFTQ